ncbi:MAG: 2-oxo acid dehydrogenase subunit E2, partial [Planctomycetota bacterium]
PRPAPAADTMPPPATKGPGQLNPVDEASFKAAHASPSVRAFARELGADLGKISGTGRKGRVMREDVIAFVKGILSKPAGASVEGGMGIPPIPEVDFSKFGPTETVALSRIKKISGPVLHRAWLNIPHVTHHDEADITELDAFRKALDTKAKKEGYRVTLLSFIMKAVAVALKAHPQFNASLAPDQAHLILKKYFNIGVAVDTPNGLIVPVVKDVDKKGIVDLSKELGDTSARARDGKLGPNDLRGGCFSISSLGGIGGTAFTPIVFAPEVAILGVTRSKMKPEWNGEAFVPRLMLPLSVSYDHRVIDGAAAARFTRFLAELLSDARRMLL